MQEGTRLQTTVEEVEDEEGFVMISKEEHEEWEMVELALAVASGEAECLEPTYGGAKKHPAWPKWKVAIQAELDSLSRQQHLAPH